MSVSGPSFSQPVYRTASAASSEISLGSTRTQYWTEKVPDRLIRNPDSTKARNALSENGVPSSTLDHWLGIARQVKEGTLPASDLKGKIQRSFQNMMARLNERKRIERLAQYSVRSDQAIPDNHFNPDTIVLRPDRRPPLRFPGGTSPERALARTQEIDAQEDMEQKAAEQRAYKQRAEIQKLEKQKAKAFKDFQAKNPHNHSLGSFEDLVKAFDHFRAANPSDPIWQYNALTAHNWTRSNQGKASIAGPMASKIYKTFKRFIR